MAATIPDELLDLMSAKFPMLSDSTRLAILRTFMQGERNVTGVNSRASRARDQIQTTLNSLARSREGEPPGEPRSDKAWQESRPPRITKGHLA